LAFSITIYERAGFAILASVSLQYRYSATGRLSSSQQLYRIVIHEGLREISSF
jgi:hypothetical protein